jgi:3,4-dihydroxy 2-butanone 4-phosphate synthase / GTP cyclohydrolase II
MPNHPAPGFSRLDDAVAALSQGQLVLVVDAKERENEGDLIAAAESITAEQVHFMLRHGAGLLCVSLLEEAAGRLSLFPIVDSERNTAPHRTAFLTPVDHRLSGSGVSPEDRANTIRALAQPTAVAADFVRPGHISPLLAKPGGVLRRAGHTEVTVDLMRMAGKAPVGALIEVVSASGRGMASLPELQQMSQQYGIPLISIDQVIQARRLRERLITRQADVPMQTRRYGEFRVLAYDVQFEDQQPLALVWGDLKSVPAPLVRMHSSCFTGDVLESLRCDCGDQLHMAMSQIATDGVGAVVYLPQEGRGIGLMAKLKAYELQDQGLDTVEANHRLGFKADSRDYGVGLQILKDLGLTSIRLLTNNPRKVNAFPGFEVEVVEQVPIIAPPEKRRETYLATKRDKLGHFLPPDGSGPSDAAGSSKSP